MNILALDLGTKTGWAWKECTAFESIVSGVKDFNSKRGDSKGIRFLKFAIWLNDEFDTDGIDLLVYEEVNAHRGTYAAQVYGGFFSQVVSYCELNKIEYQGVGVGTIKKFATGKGNSGKDKMILAAQEFDPTINDDNEADAYMLLRYAMKEWN